jgi:hypothetical protein
MLSRRSECTIARAPRLAEWPNRMVKRASNKDRSNDPDTTVPQRHATTALHNNLLGFGGNGNIVFGLEITLTD